MGVASKVVQVGFVRIADCCRAVHNITWTHDDLEITSLGRSGYTIDSCLVARQLLEPREIEPSLIWLGSGRTLMAHLSTLLLGITLSQTCSFE